MKEELENTQAQEIDNSIKQKFMLLGEVKRAVKIAKTMKKKGFSDELIQEITALPKKDIKKILNNIPS